MSLPLHPLGEGDIRVSVFHESLNLHQPPEASTLRVICLSAIVLYTLSVDA